jgi:hypothetical protein
MTGGKTISRCSRPPVSLGKMTRRCFRRPRSIWGNDHRTRPAPAFLLGKRPVARRTPAFLPGEHPQDTCGRRPTFCHAVSQHIERLDHSSTDVLRRCAVPWSPRRRRCSAESPALARGATDDRLAGPASFEVTRILRPGPEQSPGDRGSASSSYRFKTMRQDLCSEAGATCVHFRK